MFAFRRVVKSPQLALLIIVIGVLLAGLLPYLAKRALGWHDLPFFPESLLAALFGYLAIWVLSQTVDPQAISGPIRWLLPATFLAELEKLYSYEAEAHSLAETLKVYKIPPEPSVDVLTTLTDRMRTADQSRDAVAFYAVELVKRTSERYEKKLKRILEDVFSRDVDRSTLEENLVAVVALLHR